MPYVRYVCSFFFFQAEDGIRDLTVTGVQTCALPICDADRWLHRQRQCDLSGDGITGWLNLLTKSAADQCDRYSSRDWPTDPSRGATIDDANGFGGTDRAHTLCSRDDSCDRRQGLVDAQRQHWPRSDVPARTAWAEALSRRAGAWPSVRVEFHSRLQRL